MPDRISCAWEKLETLLAEPNAPALITAYWQELWPYDDIPVDVDWPRLRMFEEHGVYRVWAARVNGTLAGFVSFYIQPFVLAKSTIFALDGGHFLAPAFRDTSNRLGWRMWTSAIVALRAEGVKVSMLHDNSKRPLMPFFLAMGAEPRSVNFWMRLD